MKIVITDHEYPSVDSEREIIAAAGFEASIHQVKDGAEVIAVAHDADAMIVQYAEITRGVIEHLERCKVIVRYGIGVDNVDLAAASERGIYVCNVPDYGLDEVSTHASAMLLSLARKLPVARQSLRDGIWGPAPIKPISRLTGSTLGIVGFGALGRLMAQKMGGFGLKIIAYDPFMNEAKAKELGVQPAAFDDLCRVSDYITVHCPLTKETTHLFNRQTFAAMKKTAYLVNTSRGPVVNEKDLIDALRKGEIAGAGLDVYENEPVAAGNPLLSMPNVIATSHLAWYSAEAINVLQRKVAEEAVNVLRGNKPFNPCNEPTMRSS